MSIQSPAGVARAALAVMFVAVGFPTAFGQGLSSVTFNGLRTTIPTSGLTSVTGVARDAAGDLFILDRAGGQVIKIPGKGGSETVVATGLQMPSAIAVDTGGNLYVATTSPAQILKVAPGGSSTTVPIANLNTPSGLAADGWGNLYIADSGSASVIEYSANGTQSRVGGSWTVPVAVAADATGNVYVADKNRTSITKVPLGNETPIVIGGGLTAPQSIAVDLGGNVFAGDSTGQVFKITLAGAQTVVVSNLSPAGLAGGAVGSVFAADATSNTLLQIQTTSVDFGSTNLCGAGQTSTVSCQLSLTLNYTVNSSGILGVPLVLNGGGLNGDFALGNGSTCTGSLNSGANCSVTVNFTPLAAGLRKGAVRIVDANGNLLAETLLRGTGNGAQVAYGPQVNSTLQDDSEAYSQYQEITADEQGNVYWVDFIHLWKMPGSGGPKTLIASPSQLPWGVGVDGAGNVYLSAGQIYKYPWTASGYGAPIPIPNSGGALTIAVDAVGNVFALVQDVIPNPHTPLNANGSVVEFPVGGGGPLQIAAGNFLAQALPTLAVDSLDNVYVGNGNSLTKIPATGGQPVVQNVGGPVAVDGSDNVYHGSTEYPATGGPPVSINGIPSRLIAVDSIGNVYGSDYLNIVSARWSLTPPALSFATTILGNASSDSPQSVQIANIGNQSLTFSTLGFGGPNFRQVTGSGSPADCSNATSVLAGENCNLSISFVPAQTGLLSDALTSSDNALNGSPAVQTIPVSGAGVPTYEATTTTLQVSAQNISYGQPLTMTATVATAIATPIGSVTFFSGQTALGIVPLDASGVASLTLASLPVGTNSVSASYSATAVFLGSASPVSSVVVSPNNFSLGNVNVCPAGQIKASCTKNFNVTYNVLTTGTLGVPKVLTQGAPNLDYSLSSSTCAGAVVAGSSCTVTVAFTPMAPGVRPGAIQIFDASGAVLQTFYLAGVGVAPQVTFNGNGAVAISNIFLGTWNIARDWAGNIYYADLSNTGQILEIPANGGPAIQLTNLDQPLNYYCGDGVPVAIDGAGNVFYICGGLYRLEAATGTVTLVTMFSPFGMSTDAMGNIYYVQPSFPLAVMKVPPSGGAPVQIPAGSAYPISWAEQGIAVDARGNIYLVDEDPATFSIQIQQIPAAGGSPVTLATGLPYAPLSLRLDAAGDVFYILNDTVQEIPSGSNNAITVQSGLAQGGYDLPTDMGFDASGDMYLSYYSSGVFKIARTSAPSFNFASTILKTTSSDSPQSTQIQNSGNAPLALTKVQVSANFAQVAGSGTPADCTSSSTLVPGVQCNLSVSFIPTAVGSLAGTATFVDNSLNLGGGKQLVPLSGTGVPRITSGISLTSSLNPSTLGQAVTFTATVSAASGSSPTGTVTFRHAGVLATVPLVNGVATFTTSNLPRGTGERITAAYSGNSTVAGSVASLSQTVVKIPTTIAITSGTNPSTRTQPVTFTAIVSTASGLVPTGMVRFYNGTKLLGAATLANGVTNLTTAVLPTGTNNITAVYPATDSYAGSTSAALAQVVN